MVTATEENQNTYLCLFNLFIVSIDLAAVQQLLLGNSQVGSGNEGLGDPVRKQRQVEPLGSAVHTPALKVMI